MPGPSDTAKPLSPEAAAQRLDDAIARRAALAASGDSDAIRLVHGRADGLDGIVMERFADTLIVQHHEGRARVPLAELKTLVSERMPPLGAARVYLKLFVRDRAGADARVDAMHHDPTPWLGSPGPAEIAIHEGGIALAIRPHDGFSTGLFLEHRDNRRAVRESAAGMAVLNLFAYTCGFSVAAAVGGATEVTSVDVSPRYLDWGRRNFELNGLRPDAHRFIRDDALNYLGRARRQNRRYDLIVIDPPTFARLRRPKRAFVLREQLDALTRGALGLLAPGGTLRLSTNDRSLSIQALQRAVQAAAGARKIASLRTPALPADFAGDPDYARTLTARMA